MIREAWTATIAWGHKELDTTERTCTHTHTHTRTHAHTSTVLLGSPWFSRKCSHNLPSLASVYPSALSLVQVWTQQGSNYKLSALNSPNAMNIWFPPLVLRESQYRQLSMGLDGREPSSRSADWSTHLARQGISEISESRDAGSYYLDSANYLVFLKQGTDLVRS